MIFNDNIIYTDEADIAEIFNAYFCSVGNTLDSEIPFTNLDPLHYVEVNPKSFYLYPTCPVEVENILKSLNNSKQRIDCVSDFLLKENSHLISGVLSKLVNTCFETAVFPTCLKKAIVTPLFKKGERNIVSNYRPISKVPTISKLIEKLLKYRILSFMISSNVLSPYQFGFQSGLSTQDAILFSTEKIYEYLNQFLSIIGIFIDYSKAFDTVNTNILIRKLHASGIRGLPLQLFSSYLSDRWQAVKIGNTISSYKQCNLGVPQGSVLGPILYLIYVNEAPNISNLFTTCLFADDTSILFSDSNHENLVSSCNQGLNKFYEWSCANRLSINAAKSKFMYFTNSRESINLDDIRLHDTFLDRTPYIRCLGVELDEKLKFDLHIKNLANKIS